jgi:hypothetical protein
MEKTTTSAQWPTRLGKIPTELYWLQAILLLVLLLAVIFASGDLLAPLIGQGAYITNYLHEFTHDGRHLLGVPCH